MNNIVLASSNAHKVSEIKAIFKEMGFDVVSLDAVGLGDIDIEETGATFEENAKIKALAIHERLGGYTLADDSGLEVDALGGAPGVYSARYAGEPKDDHRNNEKLLAALCDVPEHERTGRFVTALCMIFPDGKEVSVRGTVEGIIAKAPKGTNGFGYDPLFLVPTLNKTFAELSSEEKNTISHRAHALQALKERLERK